MRILVTNDDGILAPGIAALAEALAPLGEIDVVAPETGQSGAAHAITFMTPLICERISVGGKPFGWSVDGSPADCVKLGVRELCAERPDLVVSGINAGSNLGVDVIYSGTVAAAVEAAFIGIPSIAISLEAAGGFDFEAAGRHARDIVARAIELGVSPGMVLNVNVPRLDRGGPRGVRVVAQSTAPWTDTYDRRIDPRGRTYFWLGDAGGRMAEDNADTDLVALRAGFITVTPLQYDLTQYAQLGHLAGAWPKG
ncbi:MAG TPA: 5'/3'-nucleotidase SurE [Candidatus Binatia bacterium]|nr:5'/3'-nucleotidase SurE [Candidatus Binatia bacterium]